MLDLTITPLENGGVELSQQDGSLDEPCRILLHACQVRLLCERAGLIPAPDPGLLDRLHARHVGRLHALYDRLAEIRRFYLDEILDHCGSGVEFALHLRALEDLVDEMLEDIGTAPPGEPVTKKNETSAVISVTPAKRGRPKKEDALTPAERQRAHRERQAGPGQTQQLTLTP